MNRKKVIREVLIGAACVLLTLASLAAGLLWPGSIRDGEVDQGVRAACTSYVTHRRTVESEKERAGLADAIAREAATGTNTAVIAAARDLRPAAESRDEWEQATAVFGEACFAAGWTPRTS